ncbi:hypothetical protein POM88_019528 [Heracleum sosnowskyi]|uniref:Uncharacterized protein n=1 Tax=Heracleum sosnowskyi TaxID=360622 RepID=A0AAD8ICB1_9APIA|nr:hypothetical protein POM88_019528 [Heracleum sosnowskyi]
MSKLITFVLLVFLVSLHACNARHLSLTHETIEKKSHVLRKDVHSRKLLSSFILTHSEPRLPQTQEEHSSSTGADELTDTVMGKESATVVLKKDEKTGGEVVISYSGETTQREKWRQARSTLESSRDEVEETANSEENDTIDDVVAMDYAKPHRKPPIHNRKL